MASPYRSRAALSTRTKVASVWRGCLICMTVTCICATVRKQAYSCVPTLISVSESAASCDSTRRPTTPVQVCVWHLYPRQFRPRSGWQHLGLPEIPRMAVRHLWRLTWRAASSSAHVTAHMNTLNELIRSHAMAMYQVAMSASEPQRAPSASTF